MPLLGLQAGVSALLRLPAFKAAADEREVAGAQDLQHDSRGWAMTRGIGGRLGSAKVLNFINALNPCLVDCGAFLLTAAPAQPGCVHLPFSCSRFQSLLPSCALHSMQKV
jgi:hypothetical protein